MRFGGFIITYDRPAILRQTIASVLAQSRPPERLLVADNGRNPETEAVVAEFPPQVVRYHHMGGNCGPAGTAAFALAQLVRDGYDWVWWGDDDDPPRTPDTFARLLRLAESSSEVGAVTAVGARWNWKTGENQRLADDELHGVLEVDTFGGSTHPLVAARAVKEVGVPNAAFFFGFEDYEYSLRLRRVGLHIVADGALFRDYRTLAGRLNLASRPFSETVGLKRSSWRQYYSTRNYIYFMRREFGRHDLARREAFKAVLRAASSWTHGARYGADFSKHQLMAVLHGYTGKLGRTVLPVSKY
jgi:glycosyltransferase involved in cell wall biosynthesis